MTRLEIAAQIVAWFDANPSEQGTPTARFMLSLVNALLAAADEKPLDTAFTQSFEARDWATAFVKHVERNPSIATDPDTMLGWFANAIMRGFDEHARRAEKPAEAALAAANARADEAESRVQTCLDCPHPTHATSVCNETLDDECGPEIERCACEGRSVASECDALRSELQAANARAVASPAAMLDTRGERERWLALADQWQKDPSLDGNPAFEAGVMAVIGRVRAAAKTLTTVEDKS